MRRANLAGVATRASAHSEVVSVWTTGSGGETVPAENQRQIEAADACVDWILNQSGGASCISRRGHGAGLINADCDHLMSRHNETERQRFWLVHGRDTFAAEDYYVGAYATREEAEHHATEVLKLHDHRYAGELADRAFITPPAGQGDLYEFKLRR